MITQLTKGSKYRITSASSTEENFITEGILQGFITMGEEPALLLEMEKEGKKSLRIIPVNAILMIDIIEHNEEKEKESKGDTSYIS
ncbi:MAG: hypothetical protein M1526_05455 [Candidatus Thermoplasmatota archaeon]|jgi:hypothetical protein|nr:hypothetical protein [Candidatus Thermoplasmatota archaeon]MCL5681254.1 hypothetical protein [Candidatus Thermoplasmatota archaeon]